MKKLLLIIFLIFLVATILLVYFKLVSSPVSSDTAKKDFLITKGMSASGIGDKLYQENLIKDSLTFKIYVTLSGKAGKIQAGEYEFSPSYSLFKIVDELTRGPKEIWVTIPEGLRREEIATRFVTSLEKDESFIKEFLTLSKDKEGYLFPDTYLFPKTVSASVVVNKMLATFEKKVDSKMREEVVILASLIEREAKTNAERPVIAGILNNRLSLGMALQVDATVQYAKGSWEPITKEDLVIKSPYNTYKYTGLPPGPITNPGLASIRAAIYPEDSGYLYYLHGKDGQVHYAKTLEEHNSNIAKYIAK